MLSNTKQTYGLVAQLLHWSVACLILIMIPLGIYMHELPIATQEEVTRKIWFYSLHKTLGVAALFTALVRIVWAAGQAHPRLLNADRRLESLAATTVHWLLYGSIILMPLTGWLHHAAADGFAPIWWPLGQDLPMLPKSPQIAAFFAGAHFVVGILLVVALVLHIGGALKHAIIDRDATVARMIPGAYNPTVQQSETETYDHEAKTTTFSKVLAFIAFTAVGVAAAGLYAANGTSATAPARPATTSGSATWNIDHSKSRLAITVVQSGTPVEGQFGQWNAVINFDPLDLESASVDTQIILASLQLGSVSAQALSPDFLDAAAHPVATFRSKSFSRINDNTYEAKGTLSLSGVDKEFTLPFTLDIDKATATMRAQTSLERLAFGIGKKGFETDGTVGFDVKITIEILATRSTASQQG